MECHTPNANREKTKQHNRKQICPPRVINTAKISFVLGNNIFQEQKKVKDATAMELPCKCCLKISYAQRNRIPTKSKGRLEKI